MPSEPTPHGQMQFDATLRDLWQPAADGWTIDVPGDWSQGRATFGGLMAAMAAALAYRNLDAVEGQADWALRTLNVQFLRPSTGGEVHGSYTLHRAGKGATFTQVVLSQNDATVLIAQLVFVRPRASNVDVVGAPMRAVPPAEDLAEMPYVAGTTPEFTKHIAFRWGAGAYPFTGAKDPSYTGYCRFRVPFGDAEGMIGLLDAWPCPSLSLAKGVAMSSSVMWTAHLIDVPSQTDGWFGFEYDTVVGQGGLHTAAGRLFSPDGRLIGWTEQLVTVFA